MTTKQSLPQQTVLVPKKYAGRWLAWNHDRTAIVASGDTVQVVKAAAHAAGETDPRFEWVPPANRRLIGIGG